MGFFKTASLETRKKRRGLLRAAAYLIALSGVFSLIQIRHARAEVGDKTVEIGRQMLSLANATQHDVNRLKLNGQSLYIGSSVAKDSVTDVLDRYNTLCEQSRAQPAEEWRGLADKTGNDDVKKSAVGSAGIVRGGDAEEGAVLCFTKTPSSKRTFSEAVKTFAATGELGALGGVRYVYAHKSQKGNTLVLTAWTDEQFNVKSFMGEEGKDCQGEDFKGLPRPPESTRVVSARLEDTPFGINVYRSKTAPAELAKIYDETMIKDGWMALDPELETLEPDNKHHPVGRIYEKDGLVLSMSSHIEPDATFTSMGLAGVTGRLDSATGAESKPRNRSSSARSQSE
jgi:hypothetical protein